MVFLYEFKEGACPKSYGLNVAQMANIPKSIIRAAERAATNLASKVDEQEGKNKIFADLMIKKQLSKPTLTILWHQLRRKNIY